MRRIIFKSTLLMMLGVTLGCSTPKDTEEDNAGDGSTLPSLDSGSPDDTPDADADAGADGVWIGRSDAHRLAADAAGHYIVGVRARAN